MKRINKKIYNDYEDENPVILINDNILLLEFTNKKNLFTNRIDNNDVDKYIKFKEKCKFDFVEDIYIFMKIKENIICCKAAYVKIYFIFLK